jgi:hypothetical protein
MIPEQEKEYSVIDEFTLLREQAIQQADKRNLEKIFVKPKKIPVILLCILTFLLVFLSFSLGILINKVINTPVIIQEQKFFSQSTNNQFTLINQSKEYSVSGDQELLCLQEMNSTKMICYKE